MSSDDECDDDKSSKLFDQIIKWKLPVFSFSDDEEEQRKKLQASLQISSDPSLPKKKFVPRAKVARIEEIFPLKKAVDQKIQDLLRDLLSPKCLKPRGKCYWVGEFVLTRKAMRVWKVMETCYDNLVEDRTFTEGQLCNILCGGLLYFPEESHVRKAVDDLEELMQCSRYSFGIEGTKRVMVAGPLSIQMDPEEGPAECYSGITLPREIQVLQNMTMTLIVEDIHCIIVVQEADAREALANCTLFNSVPIILITTEGIPEFITRFFLHHLSTEFPQIPIFGLVDWSPSGLEVLCSYKYGNTGSEFERNKLACGDMEWLGLTYKDIVELQKPFEYRVWARKSEQRHILSRLLEPLTGEDMEIVARLLCGELHDDYRGAAYHG